MYAEEQYRAWGELLHSVRTGEMAIDHQFGTGYFAYLAQHPEADRVFNEAMTGWTHQLVGGDFFAAVPAGGDAYVLAQILHDWDDERCVAILG